MAGSRLGVIGLIVGLADAEPDGHRTAMRIEPFPQEAFIAALKVDS